MSGRIDFTMGFNTAETAPKRREGQGFRVYILGNFSGHADNTWRERKISPIDLDNFDRVMARIEPSFSTDASLKLRFRSQDDFHPDAWLHRIPIVADLLQLKKDLSNPDTAAQAAEKIQAFYQAGTPTEKPEQTQAITESKEDMLQRLLGERPATQHAPPDSVDKLIAQVVTPFVKKNSEPQHQFLQNVTEEIIGQFLRTLLHQPDFQELEALWRATEALVNEENADQQQFFLVDISQSELQAELEQGENTFAQRLLEHSQRDEQGSDILLVSDFNFSATPQDQTLLAFLGALAKACGGRFLGSVDITLLEQALSSDAESKQRWEQYLDQIDAGNILLSYPRYLQRLPYGAKRNPLDTLAFEECSPVPDGSELVWGKSAFLCARALIRLEQSTPEDSLFFHDIDVFSYQLDDEIVLQPGTETILNEAQANDLLAHGFIPLIGFRQRQGVRLLALTSLAT